MKNETQKKGELSYPCFALLVLVFYAILRCVILCLAVYLGVDATGAGAALASGEFKWPDIAIYICLFALQLMFIGILNKGSKETLKKCENLRIFEG